MGLKSKLKHAISFLLHGEAKPIYANIHYLVPNDVYTNLKVYHFLIKKCTTPNRLQRYV